MLSNRNKNAVRHISHMSVNLYCSHTHKNIRLASDLPAIYQNKLSATYHNNPELQLNIKSNPLASYPVSLSTVTMQNPREA